MARQVVEEFRQQRWLVEVAVADTIGAAWAVAHFAGGDRAHTTTSDSPPTCSSSGCIVPPRQQAAYIKHLPVAALRLELKTLEVLSELKLCTIGQLISLPRASLPARLGTQLVRRLDQVLGNVSEQIEPISPVPCAEAKCSFPQPICSRDALAAILPLMQQIVDQLLPRQEGVTQLRLQLDGPDSNRVAFSVGFVTPCDSPEYLSQMMQSHWERQRVPREIIELHVCATTTSPLVACQVDLLGQSIGVSEQQQFWQLIDRLNVRLGEQVVQFACLVPDAQPEYAFTLQPMSQASRSQASRSKASKSKGLLQHDASRDHLALPHFVTFVSARPLWFQKQPRQINVSAALSDGPPVRFHWNGREHVVLRSWGPERIETGWWRSGPIRRDYYRVETNLGEQLWVFRQQSTGAWFLQGLF